MPFPVTVDKVGLLFTILVAKSKGMREVAHTCTNFEYYVILCSVWLLLLSYCCFCCVLYNLKGRVLLCEFESQV